MDVQARPRDASERCPYCHDALGGGPDGERVPCLGCGTSHHLACVAELGRCTVHGCQRPFFGAELERAQAGARRSSAYLAVRQRIRDRVRAFVRTNTRAPSTPPELRAAYEAGTTALREAERAGDPAAAAEALRAAARTLEAARGLDLDWAWSHGDPDDLRKRARALEERAETARALRAALGVLAILLAGLLAAALVLGWRG